MINAHMNINRSYCIENFNLNGTASSECLLIYESGNYMKDWKIVKSKSGIHKEYGCPLPEFLCRCPEDVERVIKENAIHDPVIEDYISQINE